MSGRAAQERLQPSLLDRLTDDAPEQRRESSDAQSLTSAQLRRAVLRDLAWLLNTTNLDTTEPLDGTPAVAASTLNYGIPGFTGMIRSTRRAALLEAALVEAIRRFEPRIRPETLRVRARGGRGGSGGGGAVQRLTFDIEGELWAQPVPQAVFLETTIEIENRSAVVTDLRARA